ncbi:hypothetical protein DYB34_008067 [Aphanomyces astaci]|uniref:Acyltransferase 3 domain-containing protein n=2 Tax=Aphanomyces astaci TaxID=112090 RepID=A0A418C1C2_APHAT|nr:hypothetical protein DYB34_008067 [Aphanomyces astaci]
MFGPKQGGKGLSGLLQIGLQSLGPDWGTTFVVVPVVLFHAYPLSINGGFTGVDVFFVIAGYLISGILFKENAKGSLTYADFYSRRIHRMFPALLLVLTFTLVVGCVWLLDKAV